MPNRSPPGPQGLLRSTRSVCGIWIADSDDHHHIITYVPLKKDNGMLIFHSPDHPIYGRIPRITLDTISVLSPTAGN